MLSQSGKNDEKENAIQQNSPNEEPVAIEQVYQSALVQDFGGRLDRRFVYHQQEEDDDLVENFTVYGIMDASNKGDEATIILPFQDGHYYRRLVKFNCYQRNHVWYMDIFIENNTREHYFLKVGLDHGQEEKQPIADTLYHSRRRKSFDCSALTVNPIVPKEDMIPQYYQYAISGLVIGQENDQALPQKAYSAIKKGFLEYAALASVFDQTFGQSVNPTSAQQANCFEFMQTLSKGFDGVYHLDAKEEVKEEKGAVPFKVWKHPSCLEYCQNDHKTADECTETYIEHYVGWPDDFWRAANIDPSCVRVYLNAPEQKLLDQDSDDNHYHLCFTTLDQSHVRLTAYRTKAGRVFNLLSGGYCIFNPFEKADALAVIESELLFQHAQVYHDRKNLSEAAYPGGLGDYLYAFPGLQQILKGAINRLDWPAPAAVVDSSRILFRYNIHDHESEAKIEDLEVPDDGNTYYYLVFDVLNQSKVRVSAYGVKANETPLKLISISDQNRYFDLDEYDLDNDEYDLDNDGFDLDDGDSDDDDSGNAFDYVREMFKCRWDGLNIQQNRKRLQKIGYPTQADGKPLYIFPALEKSIKQGISKIKALAYDNDLEAFEALKENVDNNVQFILNKPSESTVTNDIVESVTVITSQAEPLDLVNPPQLTDSSQLWNNIEIKELQVANQEKNRVTNLTTKQTTETQIGTVSDLSSDVSFSYTQKLFTEENTTTPWLVRHKILLMLLSFLPLVLLMGWGLMAPHHSPAAFIASQQASFGGLLLANVCIGLGISLAVLVVIVFALRKTKVMPVKQSPFLEQHLSQQRRPLSQREVKQQVESTPSSLISNHESGSKSRQAKTHMDF